jgi:uncharacterized damage-inducible protein DinB
MMNFTTIDDIYAANADAHSALKRLLQDISDENAFTRLPDEKWSIAEIVEHVSIVDEGVSKICAKLLKGSETQRPPGSGLKISENFRRHFSTINDVKLEAPERVQPTGNVVVADSLERIDRNRARLSELRPAFELYGGGQTSFPHPHFGDMSAVEWLILIGGHEARHTGQIRKLLQRLE